MSHVQAEVSNGNRTLKHIHTVL